ncbi:hypothetical protein DM02DRAFT_499343, partial [Periconia macrospinosa]
LLPPTTTTLRRRILTTTTTPKRTLKSRTFPLLNLLHHQLTPHTQGTFYRTFSYPILKTFLGALFTYQLTYYAWMKLEYFEEKQDKQGE